MPLLGALLTMLQSRLEGGCKSRGDVGRENAYPSVQAAARGAGNTSRGVADRVRGWWDLGWDTRNNGIEDRDTGSAYGFIND